MIDEQQVEELRARMARVVIRDDPAWMAEEARPLLASIDEIDGGLIALTRFQGEIGFYPDEYLEIIRTYLGK